MQSLLDDLIEAHYEDTTKGAVATYIPELAKVSSEQLGISVYTLDKGPFSAGMSRQPFTLQSISKPLVLMLALLDNGESRVFTKVGKEPTGDPFNSIVRLETFNEHKPLNPMINAGAISVCGLIGGDGADEKFGRILHFIQDIAHDPTIHINPAVYRSESETGFRNRSMAYFLKDVGNLEADVEETVDVYFRQCAIEITSEALAYIGAIFAGNGIDPLTGNRVFPMRYCRIVKSYMATCGMYDGSGAFAIDVGFPAKSGVGGGIMGTVLGRMGIGVYGPALDAKGNSYAGVRLLKHLSQELDLSIY